MITTASRRAALCCALLATTCLASPVLGQTAPPPRFDSIDGNGVDLVTGEYRFSFTEGAIGSGEGAVSLTRFGRETHSPTNWTGLLYRRTIGGQTLVHVELGAISDTFTIQGSTFIATKGDGATLTDLGGGDYRYTAPNGTRIDYRSIFEDGFNAYPVSGPQCLSGDPGSCAIPVSVTRPNGMGFTIGWDIVQKCGSRDAELNCIDPAAFFRLDGVASSAGYAFSVAYLTDTPGNFSVPQSNWYRKSGAVFTNLAAAPSPAPAVSYAYPTSGVEEVTDTGGRVWRFTTSAGGFAIRRPGAGADTTSIATANGIVTQVTRDGVTTGYSRSVSGASATMTVTNALGGQTIVTSDLSIGRPTSVKDPLNRTTSFSYDANGRIKRTIAPEGDYLELSYDARGNVTQTQAVAKGGAGTIVASAAFPAACANSETCNQPTSSTDARGQVTDFAYDPGHGGVTSITAPAAPGGVRPQTRFGYMVVSGVSLPSSTSACRTGASCAGAADEVRSTITYGANLLPTGTSFGAGDGSLTATHAMSYDPLGNLLTVDGPLPGSADTTRFRYNAAREQVGVIGPDPDGVGPLKHRAARTTIDTQGLVTRVEQGAVTDQSDAAWNAFSPLQAAETSYDAHARPVRARLVAGGATHALSQTSYDALGRPECAAVRMNPAAFASLPASACTLGAEGSFGPDRIGRTIYDAAGQVTQARTAVGTPDEAVEISSTYTDNGQVLTVTDGESNRTTYEYDGFDRLAKTRYPVPAKGADASSTSDYEELTYDAAGNTTKHRNRAGEEANYTFDALNRAMLKDLPGSEPDVSYTYDLLGQITSASQPGHALTFGYDALGRQLSETGSRGTIASQYDLAERRTRLTWPGATFFVDYDYLVTGELSAIHENGASSGVGVLASFGYDDGGRRTSLTRGNGTSTGYTYDPASRLTLLGHVFPADAAKNLTLGFSHNPAGQIVANTRSNDLYASGVHGSGSLGYTTNGLNQVVDRSGAAVSHDARGNMLADGRDRVLGYSSQNLLTGYTKPSTGAASLFGYDPLLRFTNSSSETGSLRGWLYDGHDLIAEYGTSGQLIARYVHAPGGTDEPLALVAPSGVRHWFHPDERGSVVAVSGATGTVGTINTYDEYGRPGANGFRFQYTGAPTMTSDLLYLRNRVYDALNGTFLQPDPAGYIDGPNPYPYVGGDPINFIDPLGLKKVKCLPGPAGGSIVVCGSRGSGGAGANEGVQVSGAAALLGANRGGRGSAESGDDASPNGDGDGDGQPDPDIVVTAQRPTVRSPLTHGPLYHVPSWLLRSRDRNAEPDYCGGSGTEMLPEGVWQGACIKHDLCYNASGTPRETCDASFLREILVECSERSFLPGPCAGVAGAGYLLVRFFGGLYYKPIRHIVPRRRR